MERLRLGDHGGDAAPGLSPGLRVIVEAGAPGDEGELLIARGARLSLEAEELILGDGLGGDGVGHGHGHGHGPF